MERIRKRDKLKPLVFAATALGGLAYNFFWRMNENPNETENIVVLDSIPTPQIDSLLEDFIRTDTLVNQITMKPKDVNLSTEKLPSKGSMENLTGKVKQSEIKEPSDQLYTLRDGKAISRKDRVRFIKVHKRIAVKLAKKYNVPASVLIAQSALETGWGTSELYQKHNNCFGIKTKPASDVTDREKRLIKGVASKIKTKERRNGVYLDEKHDFCSYASHKNSFEHRVLFLDKRVNGLDGKEGFDGYKPLVGLGRKDWKKYALNLGKTPYSTGGENYGKKILSIIEDHELQKLDER